MMGNQAMCRILAAFLCIALCFGNAYAADRDEANPYPEALRIQIVRDTWQAEDGRSCTTALPVTCQESVNEELANAQKALLDELLANAPEGNMLEQEATYRISGTCWAGFLLTVRAIETIPNPYRDGEIERTTYLSHAVFSYNMETGEALTLSDVFPEDSEAWETIASLMQQRYHTYYPDKVKNTEGIEEVSAVDALRTMPFLPSAGRLTLVTPLSAGLEDTHQLINTILPYPDFRPMMTDEAAGQTDNSHRNIIAITYDDGPNDVQTHRILQALNNFGANATFFCCGYNLERHPDYLCRELDYGHTVGSHTYLHRYDFQVRKEYLEEDRLRCIQMHQEISGLAPELFRAPGGNVDGYLKHQIGWPIILWRYSAGDTGNNNAYQLADRIFNLAQNGDIVLMHDIHAKTAKGTEMFLSALAENGFLFATVDELLYLHGMVPQPNTVYRDAFSPPETEPIH